MESYLNVKYYERYKTYQPKLFNMQTPKLSIPKQRDTLNCGVYLCKYADMLSQNIPLPDEFEQPVVDAMRIDIRQSLVSRMVFLAQ